MGVRGSEFDLNLEPIQIEILKTWKLSEWKTLVTQLNNEGVFMYGSETGLEQTQEQSLIQ